MKGTKCSNRWEIIPPVSTKSHPRTQRFSVGSDRNFDFPQKKVWAPGGGLSRFFQPPS